MFSERNTLYDANLLCIALDNSRREIWDDLEQDILYDQYTSPQELMIDVRNRSAECSTVKVSYFCPLKGFITFIGIIVLLEEEIECEVPDSKLLLSEMNESVQNDMDIESDEDEFKHISEQTEQLKGALMQQGKVKERIPFLTNG